MGYRNGLHSLGHARSFAWHQGHLLRKRRRVESCSRSGEATTHLIFFISRSEWIPRGATHQRRFGPRKSGPIVLLIPVSHAPQVPQESVDPSLLCPRARSPILSCSLPEQFATCPTIHVSFTSSCGMFLFMTRSNGDTPIHQLAAHGAETHRSVTTAVIQVRAVISLVYHFFSPVRLRLPTIPTRPTVIPQFLVMKRGHDDRALPRTTAEPLSQEAGHYL